MRILFLGINYWPEQTAVAPFTTGRCEYMAAHGHQVVVCTAFPFYPQWRIEPQYRGRLFAREERNGVTILRCPLYVPRRVTSFKRILHEASFLATSLVRSSAGSRPELIFVNSPPLSLSVAGILLSRLWGVPYVFHVADLQPDTAVDLGMLNHGKLVKALYGLERIAYRDAALVSTLTPAMRERIVAKGIAPEKVVLFSDWTDPPLFDIPLQGGGQEFRNSLGLRDHLLVVHAGNMGVKQGLEVILGAAQRTAANARISYLLVGDGAMRESLEDRARRMALSNLRFLPLLPTADFHDLLAAADVGLLTQQRTVADIVFPSKVLTLLASGKPVVASVSAESEVARVLNDTGAGVTVPAEDPGALADAVLALDRDPDRRRLMGERGRACALARWDPKRILPLMEARLQQVVSAGGTVGEPNAHPAGLRVNTGASGEEKR